MTQNGLVYSHLGISTYNFFVQYFYLGGQQKQTL